jgi:hypothetical protein
MVFPNDKLLGLAPSKNVGACPVPDKLIVRDDGLPFVASTIEPVTDPLAEGSKVALNVVLAPAATVVDVVRPVWPNPAPFTVIWEKLSVVLPPLCNVICCESVVPFATVPKARLVGFDEICACNPVPERAIVAGEFGALLVIEMVPEALPPVAGVKVTEKVVLDPALIDVGVKLIV